MQLNWSALSSLCIPLLISMAALQYAGGQAQQTAPAKKASPAKAKAADEIPDGPPLKLDRVVAMLKGVRAGITDEPRITAIINKRGLDFIATPENLNRLKSAGATAIFLELVAKLKPPEPQPLPPPPIAKPVTGTLRLLCAPAECNIRLDGGPDKITKDGTLTIDELVFKQYTVDFRKEGYLPKSEQITLAKENSPKVVPLVTLEVLPEVREGWGKALHRAAVQAIGGPGGLAELKSMTATGGASSWSATGAQSEWTIKAVFSGNNYAYELNNPSAGTFAISCQDEICGAPKGQHFHKKASGPDADALNTNLRQYNRFHLEALLKRIGEANHKLMANTAPSAGAAEQHLLVDSPDESYDITLDGAFLPIAVSYRSKDGLATVKIAYAQYESFTKGTQYPKLTSIALPGDSKHGIRVKYDSVVQKP